MGNIVDKVIKLCNRICSGNYPITILKVYNYDKEFTINKLTIALTNDTLNIYTNEGNIYVNITDVDRAKLVIAFDKLLTFSKQASENILDEYINVENTKISNVNELDCDNN